MSAANIEYINRQTGAKEIEKVYGEGAVKWLYRSKLGNFLSKVITHPLISQFYGDYQDHPASADKIPGFIENYDIKMSEFLPTEGRSPDSPYATFNEFFTRRFREGVRSFPSNTNELGAFAEARYLAWDMITEDQVFPVKGKDLSSKELLANSKWDLTFESGPLMIARLCPVDYHRYHFPDNGELVDEYRVHGDLHSVNPIALKEKSDIFLTNERHVSILKTENFGHLAYIEVGATCVGKIVQTHKGAHFKKGDEKGMFLFGGSTVIVIGEKGKWLPSKDILDNTQNKIETYIKLGESIGLS